MFNISIRFFPFFSILESADARVSRTHYTTVFNDEEIALFLFFTRNGTVRACVRGGGGGGDDNDNRTVGGARPGVRLARPPHASSTRRRPVVNERPALLPSRRVRPLSVRLRRRFISRTARDSVAAAVRIFFFFNFFSYFVIIKYRLYIYIFIHTILLGRRNR